MEEPEDCAPLQSKESTVKVYVRFVNTTRYTMEILWLNFTGQSVRYQLLRSHSYVDVDTFKTHPWIARNVITKDRMLIEQSFIYMPKTTKEYLQEPPKPDDPNRFFPSVEHARRRLIMITVPLYSLRYCTLLAIRNMFMDESEVDHLELPLNLSEDLKRVIRHRNNQWNVPALTALHQNR